MPGSFLSTLKFVAVAGVGLFGDGYLNVSIGLSQSTTYSDPQQN